MKYIEANLESDLKLVANEIRRYMTNCIEKADKLTKRLADIGLEVMSMKLLSAEYDGTNDTQISVEKIENGYKVVATGQAVLFIEFGAGATKGEGHPWNDEFGMGPSTWSLSEMGKGHWDSPYGWFFRDESGVVHHSYGNPPAQAMVTAQDNILNSVKIIAQEVFRE